MDVTEKLAWSIEASVHWYDAMCEAHGVPGEHHDDYWVNRRSMPPYMSNLITLRDDTGTAAQVAAIRSLIGTNAGYGVKDSFQCLSLGELGLRVLFRATWIFRPEGAEGPKDDGALEWRVVRTPLQLQAWESTWRGVGDNAEARQHPAVFPPSLLHRSDFRFLLGERGGKAVATAALNRTAHAVGLSNVFAPTEEPDKLFPGCVRLACSIFPGLPLVGYERDAHLVAAKAAGFETVHGLTVWVPAEVV
ncbi:MAG: hypothetical protein EOO73_04785 [Myxococcales bacterium]|nr:MAG: hypothetical protein EOO73_04785 [Myxococcales bacterium]